MIAGGRRDPARGSGAGSVAAVARAVDRAVVSRDGEARAQAEALDAARGRTSLVAARERIRELEELRRIPVTPEEEFAWVELERRCGLVS